MPGIKFVPLRTNGGEHIPESGLFVRIKMMAVKEDKDHHSTSSRGDSVESSKPGIDVTKSLNVEFNRIKFTSKKQEAGDSGSDSDDFSSCLQRRKTCPSILHNAKQSEVSFSSGDDMTMHAEASANAMEVFVEVHLEEEGEGEKEKENRKSYSIDVMDY